MTCLVVDSSPTMVRIIGHVARGHDCEVVGAGDAVSAREILAGDRTIDLILVEWDLPGGGGLELVRELRADEATATTPILMMSARNSRSDVNEAIEAKIDGYILKPFSEHTIDTWMGTLLVHRESDVEPEAGHTEPVESPAEPEEDASPEDEQKAA